MDLVFLQRLRPVIAICLALTMLIGLINGQGYLTFADEALTGMIYSEDRSMVTTRKEPSDSTDKRNNLVYGKPVTVAEEVTDAEGAVWYKLTYDLKAGGTSWGYCRAENVLLDKDAKAYAFGTINATHVAVRNDAGSDGTTILFYLDTGIELELLDTTTVDGNLWYRVRYINGDTATIGWVYGKYIDLVKYNVEIDPAYVEELKTKGFPESYTYNLAVLHALYPQWIFEPVMTGLDWNTVIEKETERPINMVPISSDDAMKSVASTEYNWTTNTWVIRDGDSWVAVHPEYLAYCMDPRNFLTEQYIFQFESLSYSELHTIEGVNAVIGGTFMATDVTDADGTTLNYANAFMSIGKEVGVSPYHLASRVRQEQGRGKSSLISGTYPGYEGYFNYFNFGASGVTDKVVIENGLKYAKNKGWNTRYKSLLGGSQAIAQNYIARGQDTLYFQKFNVVWKDMLYGHQYMGNVTAAISEGKEIADAYTDKNQAFVFRIPVYENMPEKAVEFKVSGNRNNYLKDLSVSGLSLTPTFTGATTEYTLIVEEAISSITVAATPVVEAAEVSGTGTHKLVVGTNTIKILCESESGDVRTYTLTVVREGVEEPTEPEVPTEPEEPTEPEVPTESEEPTEPEVPTESEEPTEPETPTESEEPTEPETPTESEEPTEPDVPAEIKTDKYILGTYLTGVEPGTTAADFLAGFTLIGGAEMKLLDKNGAENTGTVATGNVLNVYDEGTLIATHEIVIYGDVNGDGRINILDAIKLNRHTIGITPVSGCYLEAADASRDGRANILDSIVINRFTIGLVTINQK